MRNSLRQQVKVFKDLRLRARDQYPEYVTPEWVEKLQDLRKEFFEKLNEGTYDEVFGKNLRTENQNLLSDEDLIQRLGFMECKRTVDQVVNKAHLQFLLPEELFQKIYAMPFKDRLTNKPSIGNANFISYIEEMLLDYGKSVQDEKDIWKKNEKSRKENQYDEKGNLCDHEGKRKKDQASTRNGLLIKFGDLIKEVERVHHLIGGAQPLIDMTPKAYKELLDEFLLMGESKKKSFIEDYFLKEEEEEWSEL